MTAAVLLAVVLVPFAGAQAAAQPTCTILDFTFTETDGASSTHAWNLRCSNPTGAAESATFATVDATAKGPADYIPLGGTLPVPPGVSTLPILFDVVGDDTPEPTEAFALQFEDPEGVVQFRDGDDTGDKAFAVITIDDDDGFTVTSVSSSAPEGNVGSSVAEVEVTLNEPVDRPFEVLFYTSDVGATAGSDYEAVNVRLGFEPGEVSKLVPITILGDQVDEPDEAVFLGLGIEGLGTLVSGGLTIVDDDDPGGGGPCIMLSDTSIEVSGPFSTPSNRGFAGPLDRIELTNCGEREVGLRARGTHATGAGASWELTNVSSGGSIDSTCELGTDLFRGSLMLWNDQGGSNEGAALTTQDEDVIGPSGNIYLEVGAPRELAIQVELPCQGSDGAGQPMSMDVVLTAVEP